MAQTCHDIAVAVLVVPLSHPGRRQNLLGQFDCVWRNNCRIVIAQSHEAKRACIKRELVCETRQNKLEESRRKFLCFLALREKRRNTQEQLYALQLQWDASRHTQAQAQSVV